MTKELLKKANELNCAILEIEDFLKDFNYDHSNFKVDGPGYVSSINNKEVKKAVVNVLKECLEKYKKEFSEL